MTVATGDARKSPEVIVLDKGETDSVTTMSWKSRVTKKRLIAAVSSVLIAVIVVAGILVAVKFFLDSQNDIVKRTSEVALAGKDASYQGDLTSDVTNNVVEYHMLDEGKEVWIQADYNRGIQLTKVKTSGGVVCFVKPLNQTDSIVEDIRNVSFTSDPVDVMSSRLRISEKPVKDKSFIGQAGEKLCAKDDVYWTISVCDEKEESTLANNGTLANSRRKRSLFAKCEIEYSYPCGISHWKIKWCSDYLFVSWVPCFGDCDAACAILAAVVTSIIDAVVSP